MMTLSLQAFADWTNQQAAAVQAKASALIDLTVGSTLRAILEANSGVALWMQWLILLVLRMTRAATSDGADLDTWMADFGLARLPAVAASGAVTFARFTAVGAVTVPAGTIVKTADGTVSFATVADATMATGASSVAATVTAQTAGIAGNVLAGTITLISAALPGVDTVTNALAFTNGIDAESDDALRARFQNYINTRAEATEAAVGYAVSTVRQGLTWTIQENTLGGVYTPGNFVVTVNDGTGAPSSALLTLVQAAVDAVRPVGSTFQVAGPSVILANINLTVVAAAGYTHAQAVAATGTALTALANQGGMGVPLYFGQIYQTALNLASVAYVEGVTLNGGTSDLTVTAAQSVAAGTISVS